MLDSVSDTGELKGDNSPRSSRKQLLRNGIYSSGSWMLNVIVVMVATPFIVWKLGTEGYGIYALLTGLVGYYGLLDFGLGQGVVKFVAQFQARGDLDGAYRSINAALWVQAIAGLTGSLLVVVFAEPILRIFGIPPILIDPSRISLYVAAVGFFFTMLSGTFSSALMGLQMFVLIGRTNVILNVCLTCFILLALSLGGGLIVTVCLTAISAVAMFLVYYLLLRSKLSGYQFSFGLDRSSLKTLASYSGYLFISKVSSTFGLYVVRFVVGYFLGPIGVTFFVVPSKLINAVGGLLSSATGVLFPFSSSLAATADDPRIRNSMLESSKYLASLAIPLFLFVSMFSRLIMTVWMGSEFADHTWLLLTLLAFGSLLGSLTAVPNLITMGLGYSRIVGIFSIVSLGFYLVLLPLLTSWFGLTGTGWAIFAATLPGLLLVRFELLKIFHVSLMEFWHEVLRVHLIPIIVVASICFPSNDAGYLPSLVFSSTVVVAFCIYMGTLVSRGYLPIVQWGKQFLDHA